MMESASHFRFGQFELRGADRLLSKNGVPVRLTVKAFDLLEYMVANPQRLLTTEELMAHVWSDVHVDRGTLQQNIHTLRDALSDDLRQPGYIETVARKGYRFVAAVSGVDVAPAEQQAVPETTSPPRGHRRLWFGAAAIGLLVGIGFVLLGRGVGPIRYSTLPLISGPGMKDMPAYSPDGKRLLYVQVSPGSSDSDLFLYDFATTSRQRVASLPGRAEFAPAWSPNGKHAAFFRQQGDAADLVVHDLESGAERVVLTEPMSTLGPLPRLRVAYRDGERLIVISPATRDRSAVWSVELASGERSRFELGSSDGPGPAALALSPGGKELVVLDELNGPLFRVVALDLRSRRTRVILETKEHLFDVAWPRHTPAKFLLTGIAPGQSTIWEVDAATGRRTPVIESTETIGTFLTVSPPGPEGSANLVFGAGVMALGLWQAERLGASWQVTSIAPMRRSRNVDPQYSPDGKRFAFASDRGGAMEIWIGSVDGRELRQLTHEGGDPGTPRWSPDGRTIAYDRMQWVRRDIFLADVETGRVRELEKTTTEEARPAYSRDGQSIYFAADRDGALRIWRQPVQGGPAERISQGIGMEPQESIDGRSVYFIRDAFRPGLWALDLSTRQERLVLDRVWQGMWAPVQGGVAFAQSRAAMPGLIDEIAWWDEQTGQVTFVGPVRGWHEHGTPTFAAAPDMSRFLLAMGDFERHAERDLVVVKGYR